MKIACCGHFHPKWHRNHFSSVSSVSSFGIHSSLITPVFYIKKRSDIFRFLSKYVRPHIKRNKYLAFIRRFCPLLCRFTTFPPILPIFII